MFIASVLAAGALGYVIVDQSLAASTAVSPSYIADQTRQVVTKRLKFAGFNARVVNVRCTGNGPNGWFCIVRLTDGEVFAYNVTLRGSLLNWKIQQ